ncbi:MAG: twin-arginine translocase subunit TatC [Elusimicrobia bacterium]|nr:twin-arginine translocase subunit TatC [Elusimicrobiota bacterium]
MRASELIKLDRFERELDAQREDPPMPLVEHLAELRRRLIVSLILLAAAAAFAFGFSASLLSWLSVPAGGLVFVAPTEALYTRLRVAVYAGFLLALPLILHQAWLFVARALEPIWRRSLAQLLPFSYLLFILGTVLALGLVAPAAMGFLISAGPEGVRPMISVGAYLDFLIGLSLAFGMLFQLPVVMLALNRAGALSRRKVSGLRRPIYLGLIAAAALLTPGPDVFSQVALSLPSIALFEMTLLFMNDA